MQMAYWILMVGLFILVWVPQVLLLSLFKYREFVGREHTHVIRKYVLQNQQHSSWELWSMRFLYILMDTLLLVVLLSLCCKVFYYYLLYFICRNCKRQTNITKRRRRPAIGCRSCVRQFSTVCFCTAL